MADSTQLARFPLMAAGFFGLSGVSLGALGAHALAARLAERGMTHAWETAAKYHLVHALGLLAIGVWLHAGNGAAARRLTWAAGCWVAGIFFFSFSIYGLALGGPRWLGPVTPLGGVALMAGWALVIAASFPPRK